MSAKLLLCLGTLYGGLGVVLGAFGAHALRARLTVEQLGVWKTAVDYQLVHALALLAVGLWWRQSAPASPGLLGAAGGCFAAGVLLFSGSLYALTLSGVRGLGAITPLGGALMIAGWLLLLVAAARS